MLLGPQYAAGVIVTQVVPALDGYSSLVLQYKSALERYFPGEIPDYVSFEGYVAAQIMMRRSSAPVPSPTRRGSGRAGEHARLRLGAWGALSTSAGASIKDRTGFGAHNSANLANTSQ